MSEAAIITGDCLREMAGMEPDSYDAIVTDPPYGLGFMGKQWDAQVPGPEYWQQMLRVAKPGAHLVAFGGTRTFHRMMVAIEDAGWEIRDTIMWVYGSGFPKSHNVSLSIDKAMGHGNRGKAIPTASTYQASDLEMANKLTSNPVPDYTAKTEEAQKWQGWGTALKPAWEPIILARKPLQGTVAQNVMNWGTGALNIDESRIPFASEADRQTMASAKWTVRTGVTDDFSGTGGMMTSNKDGQVLNGADHLNEAGRWPANVMHDGSEEVTAQLGEAARFFYGSKANRKDRDEGLEDFEPKGARPIGISNWEGQTNGSGKTMGPSAPRRNTHPTVKPTDLMRYLVRLVSRKGAVVLDPFAGSGSTGKAAVLEGRHFVGIETNDEYAVIARARIDAVK